MGCGLHTILLCVNPMLVSLVLINVFVLRPRYPPICTMNFFQETLMVLILSIYYPLEAFVKLFLPARRKNVVGEIVLITGAGSGIGRLMALEFCTMGVILVLWDINEDGNKETARLAKEKCASEVYTYICDCSKKTEVYRVADQVIFWL